MNWARVKVWVYRVGLFLGALIFLVQLISGVQAFQSNRLPVGFRGIALWSIVGMVLVVGLQIINWSHLLKIVGVHLPLLELSKGYVLSSLPKYIPGSIWGYISRSQWLSQEHEIPHSSTNLANLFEIEVTLVSATSVILLGLGIVNGSWLYLAAALLLPATILSLTRTLIRLLLRKGWFGLAAIPNQPTMDNRYLWLATLISGVQWLILGGATLLLVAGVKPQIQFSLREWLLAVQCFTLAWLGGFFVIFVPGGLGIRELALTGLIMTNFSANYQTATLVAIGSRLVYSAGEIIWLGIGLLQKAGGKGKQE